MASPNGQSPKDKAEPDMVFDTIKEESDLEDVHEDEEEPPKKIDIDSLVSPYISPFPLLEPLPPIDPPSVVHTPPPTYSYCYDLPSYQDLHPLSPPNAKVFDNPENSNQIIVVVPHDKDVVIHKQAFDSNPKALEAQGFLPAHVHQKTANCNQPTKNKSRKYKVSANNSDDCELSRPKSRCDLYKENYHQAHYKDQYHQSHYKDNPNWLPGLPIPPPGVFVQPPMNRSRVERLRYLSRLHSYQRTHLEATYRYSKVPNLTWKLYCLLFIVFSFICLGSFIRDRICDDFDLSCSYRNKYNNYEEANNATQMWPKNLQSGFNYEKIYNSTQIQHNM